MSKKAIALVIILILVMSTCLIIGCTPKGDKQLTYDSFDFFGTQATLAIIGQFPEKSSIEKTEQCWEEIKAELQRLDNLLSISNKNSEISKFNDIVGGEKLQLSKTTYDLLVLAKEMYTLTNGAYNPSVYWLVDLWGFTPRFYDIVYTPTKIYDRQKLDTPPEDDYINLFKQLTNFGDIKLEKLDNNYYITKPDNFVSIGEEKYYMALDLGGIAKGYAVDMADEIIQEYNFKNGYFSFGSSSITLKKFPKQIKQSIPLGNWSLGLTNPKSDSSPQYARLFVNDTRVGSSGNYEKFYTHDNIQYCHIIDASTGMPIRNGMMASTVLSPNASINDALSTAICVMGYEKAIALTPKLQDYLITFAWQIEKNFYYWSNVPSQSFELIDTSYKLWEVK